MTPEKYLKFLYILYGRSIPKICFWNMPKNPHRNYLECMAMKSGHWEDYFEKNKFVDDALPAISGWYRDETSVVKFTEKFWDFIENS